jgi:hypothetical protein
MRSLSLAASVVALVLAGSTVALLPGCGSDESTADTGTTNPYPYDKNKTVVIGPNGETQEVVTPAGDDCLVLAGDKGECSRPQNECGEGARADVVIDAKGKVVAVFCYPVDGTPVSTVPEEGADHVGAENKEVVVIDGKDDGVDVTGDVDITGNNVVVYGSDPATSIIGGDLNVAKNNGTVRGVRILGDVHIDGNNTALVDCIVDGDVIITSNNDAVVTCTVFGKIVVSGNNNQLYYNDVAGSISGEAKNLACEGNRAFADTNEDKLVTEDELGAPLTCGG